MIPGEVTLSLRAQLSVNAAATANNWQEWQQKRCYQPQWQQLLSCLLAHSFLLHCFLIMAPLGHYTNVSKLQKTHRSLATNTEISCSLLPSCGHRNICSPGARAHLAWPGLLKAYVRSGQQEGTKHDSCVCRTQSSCLYITGLHV